ncbi:MAG: Xaa-Pro dipeptidase [Idiomarina sp.]|nr:Xaa-Pro dipeptidase [Idiomarina sp.]
MDYEALFPAHVREMKARADQVCERENLELLAIHSGQIKRQFLDDMEYPFKVNPLFKAWCPLTTAPHCWLLISPKQARPTLVFLHSDDFWVSQTQLDNAPWLTMFHVELISRPDQIDRLLPYDKQHAAYLGEHPEVAQALGFMQINPEPVLSFLHYHRLFKTPYEQQCVRRASELAIRGHRAVAKAWQDQASEFECLQAFIGATEQGENDAPYPHIIAQNEHAAVLHYGDTLRHRLPAGLHRSLMIDAGASWHGYASDISRSYAGRDAADEFAELIMAMDQITQALAQEIKPGMKFAELHERAHMQLAQILFAFGIVRMDPEEMVRNQVTQVFMPHSIGHMLGLQVHDVGGTYADERGTVVPPPQHFPHLKTTRTLEPRMILTVEPGLYFIDVLLNRLQDSDQAKVVDWKRVRQFQPYGGIRIEDNVLIHRDRNENMTRELGLS